MTPISDTLFDSHLPQSLQDLSENHWTTVAIARRAARLATTGHYRKDEECRVLDVGSGVGKFCIVGALSTTAHFVGVEQRESLTTIARDIAEKLAVPRVDFVTGNLDAVDWRDFHAIYMFNPFSENLDETARIDETCQLKWELFMKYVDQTDAHLSRLAKGTRVVTLNGYGGRFPDRYRQIHHEVAGGLSLELWRKE